MYLNNKELIKITGGGYGLWAILGGVITFIISAIVCIIASIKKKSMKGALEEAERKYYEQKSLCETLQAEMSAVNSQK